MKTKRTIKEVLWCGGEALTLYLMLNGNRFAENIFIFYVNVVFILSIIVLVVLTANSEGLFEKMGFNKIEISIKSRVIPQWILLVFDLSIVTLLVGYNFWSTAGQYLFSIMVATQLRYMIKEWYNKKLTMI